MDNSSTTEASTKTLNLDLTNNTNELKEPTNLSLKSENSVVINKETVTKSKMKQVSISEFMYKNIHLLGFENSSRALNVTFKECLDNSLDACNKFNINPKIEINLRKTHKNLYCVSFKDNGPGVDPQEAPNICCRLLYGQKFEGNEMLRGQQGLGLTSIILYAQKTTNRPVTVTTKRIQDTHAEVYKLEIDVQKNRPKILSHKKVKLENFESGFIVELELGATYIKKGNHSPLSLIEQYLYLNPNLSLYFKDDEGNVIEREAITNEAPPKLKSVKPLPLNQEFGEFVYNLTKNKDQILLNALEQNFEITYEEAKIILKKSFFSENQYVGSLNEKQYIRLKEVCKQITLNKTPKPEETIDTDPNLVRVITKDNSIHFNEVIQTSSTPLYFKNGVSRVLLYGFYGGDSLAEDNKIEVYRVGNNSPLRYQASSCVITKTISAANWKKAGFMQAENELPKGKLILIVHVCATKIPYTTESKDAIADDPTIRLQIEECLEVLIKKIKRYLSKLQMHKVREEKCHVVTKILPELKKSLNKSLGKTDESKEELLLLSRIIDLPCLYVHKQSENMVVYNPTKKIFEISMHDKKDLKLVQKLKIEPYTYKVFNQKYDPKTKLLKGPSHVMYHVFNHPLVLKYEYNDNLELMKKDNSDLKEIIKQ